MENHLEQCVVIVTVHFEYFYIDTLGENTKLLTCETM